MIDFFGDESNFFYQDSTIAEFEGACIDFAAKIAETGSDVLDIDGIHLSRKGHEMLLEILLPRLF